MGRKVDIDDLVDARGVAELLGLRHPNTVSVYQHRHADMPHPAIDLGKSRVKLWLRSEISAWARELEAAGRNRPGRRPSPQQGSISVSAPGMSKIDVFECELRGNKDLRVGDGLDGRRQPGGTSTTGFDLE